MLDDDKKRLLRAFLPLMFSKHHVPTHYSETVVVPLVKELSKLEWNIAELVVFSSKDYSPIFSEPVTRIIKEFLDVVETETSYWVYAHENLDYPDIKSVERQLAIDAILKDLDETNRS